MSRDHAKNYYPVGSYQVVLYDPSDEPIRRYPWAGSLIQAQQMARLHVQDKECHTSKVLRVVYDTRDDAQAPQQRSID